ncbi:MAG: VPLPA-CTERM sorting domain-containing protein, partial [Pseudomonadota bacterium]|nr:VPLPA-CTERM sorting domain-containing protein [Pseudomonadota bacterium]
MKNLIKSLALSATLALVGASASAAVITLDFEGVAPTYPHSNNTLVQDFYNGGTSSSGTSGTNYGVAFSDNALAVCLNTQTTSCSNGSRGGEGNPNSQLGALFFLTGSETFMNVAAGFDTGFSFFYSAINQGGSVSVFDGLNGTGNLLASISLGTTSSNCTGYGANFCPFVASGIAFSGIAKSVSFGGVADQVAFDDVTFGSVTPDPGVVPLPAGLPLLGAGLMALG